MNKQHLKGTAEKGKGKIKEAAGHLTGNKKLEVEGRIDQVKGVVHNVAGDVKDAVKQPFKKR
jgi:uncharacterized protein YjbJ (UPF0337 family)